MIPCKDSPYKVLPSKHPCYTFIHMKRLISLPKTFTRTFIKSLTEPQYYRDVLEAKFSFSLKYFLFFYFLLALVTSVFFWVQDVPGIRTTAQDVIHQLTTDYPNDLVLKLENGTLVVEGVDQPVIVPFPNALSDIKSDSGFEHLAAIDTTTQIAAENTFLTFTQNEVILRNPDGTKQSYPFESFSESITIDRNTIQLITSASQSYIDLVIRYLPFGLFLILAIFQTLGSLFSLLIYSMLTYVVSGLIRRQLTYKKAFQLGLHTITFAETVHFLQDHLFPSMDISMFFPVAFFGATFIALWSIKPSIYTPKTQS